MPEEKKPSEDMSDRKPEDQDEDNRKDKSDVGGDDVNPLAPPINIGAGS